MYVIKRDKSLDNFNKNKIIDAINKAFLEVDGQLYETDTAHDIAVEIEEIGKSRTLSVEEIQDLIETKLMQSERKDVAKAYIRFRYKKEVAREQKDTFFKAISDKLAGIGIENANANMDENSFSGRIGSAASVMTKEHALRFQMSDLARTRHENNEIYTHDLDHYSTGDHNCLTCPLDHLLANGFKVRQTDVRPAGSVSTAFQLMAVIFQLQSLQQFGGISAGHIDWTMVPYVRKSFTKHFYDGLKFCERKSRFKIKLFKNRIQNDLNNDGTIHLDNEKLAKKHKKAWAYAMSMTEREIHQAAEGAYHNLK